MKTIRAEPRQGSSVAIMIKVDSTLQEEIILTAEEGIRLAKEILSAPPVKLRARESSLKFQTRDDFLPEWTFGWHPPGIGSTINCLTYIFYRYR